MDSRDYKLLVLSVYVVFKFSIPVSELCSNAPFFVSEKSLHMISQIFEKMNKTYFYLNFDLSQILQ